MGLFNFFKEKKDIKPNHVFTDDDREDSIALRKIRRDKKIFLEQVELEKAKAELQEIKDLYRQETGKEEQDFNSPEAAFFRIAEKVITKKMLGDKAAAGQEGAADQDQGEEIPPIQLSDEEITGIIEKFVPTKMKLLAKVLSEENLKRGILQMDEQGFLSDEDVAKIARRLKQ